MSCRQFILLPLFCMLCACSGLGEARHTVATADSMRVNEGRLYANGVPANNVQRGVGDSLALAEAYVTTGKWRYIYPNDYARACYYYGRLLRSRGDQVAAMQAFIAGTHAPYVQRLIPLPHFRDYHILGRIYTNMGTMCHLVDEFQLSYAMYEQSAIAFQKSSDTTAYYYALNDMAFELAEDNNIEAAIDLICKIQTECTDMPVISLTYLTQAEAYLNRQQYDTAVYYANLTLNHYHEEPASLLIKAQAYSFLHITDSAVYYAGKVTKSIYASNKQCYNALYILSHDSSNLSNEELLSLTSDREDINNYDIKIQGELFAQAVQLLRQDSQRKPDYWRWSFIFFGLCVLIIALVLLIIAKRKQQINHIERGHILQETNLLQQQKVDLREEHSAYREQRIKNIEDTCKTFASSANIEHKLHTKNYDAMKRIVDIHFGMFVSTLETATQLNEREILFCVLVLLNVPHKKIAKILVYSEKSITKLKSIIAKKLGTTVPEMRNTLISIALHDTPYPSK